MGWGRIFVHLSSFVSSYIVTLSLSFYSRSSRLAVVKHKQFPTVSDVRPPLNISSGFGFMQSARKLSPFVPDSALFKLICKYVGGKTARKEFR